MSRKTVLHPKNTTVARNELLRGRVRVVLPPVDIDEQNILAEEMVSHVSVNNTYVLEEFPISHNMAPSRFYKLADVNEYFAHALNLARYIIAARLQNQWRERKIDRDYAIRMLPMYHETYYDIMMMRAKSDAEGKEKARLTVMIDSIEDSPKVPAKKKHE